MKLFGQKNFNKYRKEVMLADSSSNTSERIADLIEAENYQLIPFEMVIQDYEDETHNLPQ